MEVSPMQKYLTWIKLSTCKIELDQIIITAEYDKILTSKQILFIKQSAIHKLNYFSVAIA
jgi:hypothetical protein